MDAFCAEYVVALASTPFLMTRHVFCYNARFPSKMWQSAIKRCLNWGSNATPISKEASQGLIQQRVVYPLK